MTVDSGKNYEFHSAIKRKGTRTIVDIIQSGMGVAWVIDDQWTSQTIAILGREMRMIPKCPCLAIGLEVV